MKIYRQSPPIAIASRQILVAAILTATLVAAANKDAPQENSIATADENSNKKYDAMDIAGKSPAELIKLRGFKADVSFATTPDGYKLHMVHLKNPKIDPKQLKRPVLFMHGFIASSTMWLINSRKIAPLPLEDRCPKLPLSQNLKNFNETQFINGPMMLANRGYDVWLVSLRGTEFSKHETLTRDEHEFWNFTLDDFALKDLPTAIDYVIDNTGVKKIGFVAHSQGTFAMFGLLSTKPEYSNKLEPVVAIGPIAHLEHIHSVLTPLLRSKIFADVPLDAPFPPKASEMRKSSLTLCKEEIQQMICSFVQGLTSGNGKNWPRGMFTHAPFTSSFKVAQQFAQLHQSKKVSMFDYGKKKNLDKYGSETPPEYPLENFNSTSLLTINAKSDALSTPKDVAELKETLKSAGVKIYREIFIDRDNINHNDMIVDPEGAKLVFGPILEVFEEFERKTGSCAPKAEKQNDEIIEEPIDNAIEITTFDLTE